MDHPHADKISVDQILKARKVIRDAEAQGYRVRSLTPTSSGLLVIEYKHRELEAIAPDLTLRLDEGVAITQLPGGPFSPKDLTEPRTVWTA